MEVHVHFISNNIIVLLSRLCCFVLCKT